MFEIGKKYLIERVVGNDVIGSANCIVLDYDDQKGLLKIDHFGSIEIINVASPNFVGAKPNN